jgi:hypothetical protein
LFWTPTIESTLLEYKEVLKNNLKTKNIFSTVIWDNRTTLNPHETVQNALLLGTPNKDIERVDPKSECVAVALREAAAQNPA